MTVLTYTGTLHNGKVELPTQANLPEGSEVYVLVAPGIDKRTAQRRANGWAVNHVGNMVMASDGVLVQQADAWVWRFQVYLTSLQHEPYGPVGQIEIDANSGVVLSDRRTIEAIYKRGARFLSPT